MRSEEDNDFFRRNDSRDYKGGKRRNNLSINNNVTNFRTNRFGRKYKPVTMKLSADRRHDHLSVLNNDRCCHSSNRDMKDKVDKNRKVVHNSSENGSHKRKLFSDKNHAINGKNARAKKTCLDAALPLKTAALCHGKSNNIFELRKKTEANDENKKNSYDRKERFSEIIGENANINQSKLVQQQLPLLVPVTTMLVTPARVGLLPTPRFGSGLISYLPNPNENHQAQASIANMIANNAAALQALQKPSLLANLTTSGNKQASNSSASNIQATLVNAQPLAGVRIRNNEVSGTSTGKATINCLPLPPPTTSTVLIPNSNTSLLPTPVSSSSVAIVTSVASIISTGNVSLLTSVSAINTTPPAITLLPNTALLPTQPSIPIITNPIDIAATQAAVALASSTSDMLPPPTMNGQEKPKPKVVPPPEVLEKAAQLNDKLRATQAISALRLSTQLQNINSMASASIGQHLQKE